MSFAGYPECGHPVRKATKRVYRNGSIHCAMQCIYCGQGDKAKKPDNIHLLPLFDEGLRERYLAIRKQYWLLKKAEFWQVYSDYLKSEVWSEKRKKVLARDKGLCVFCQNQAQQVHHEKYPEPAVINGVYNHAAESLDDLISVCKRCHDNLHNYKK